LQEARLPFAISGTPGTAKRLFCFAVAFFGQLLLLQEARLPSAINGTPGTAERLFCFSVTFLVSHVSCEPDTDPRQLMVRPAQPNGCFVSPLRFWSATFLADRTPTLGN